MKAFVIVQPGAGKGDSHDAVREALDHHFTQAGIEFEVYAKLKENDPGGVVRSRLGDGFDLVVAAGGDGTVSSVLDGLHGSTIPLGIIPTGTGNLIAREFEIPTDVDDAVALIAGTPRQLKIDAMKIGKRVYVLNAGVGINATVIAGTTGKSKRLLGRFAYFATAIRIFKFLPRRLDVTVDGTKRRYRAVEVAISNCGILARTMYPKGPDIRSDDGHVDIWILSMESFLDYVRYLVGIAFGRRAKAQFLIARKNIVIESHIPLRAQADGDIIGTTPLTVDVLPGAFVVLVPQPPDED
jgi:YegS/Rv2252/BmrU family lipid kinase